MAREKLKRFMKDLLDKYEIVNMNKERPSSPVSEGL